MTIKFPMLTLVLLTPWLTLGNQPRLDSQTLEKGVNTPSRLRNYNKLMEQPVSVKASQFVEVNLKPTIHPTSGLVHPGILSNSHELNALSAELRSGTPVNLALWQHMVDSQYSNPKDDAWQPGKNWMGYTWATPGRYHAAIISDALRWIMEKDKAAEGRAIKMLNAWAAVESFELDLNDSFRHERLFGGIKFGYLAYAADLLAHSNSSWSKADQKKFKAALRRIYLPMIDGTRPNFYNGNWDLGATWSSMAIAVFLDDRALFDWNINRLKSFNITNGSIYNYLLPSGQNAETGRDQTHAQMGMYFMALCAQVAWNQGSDLFEREGRSIGRSYEYLAKYKLGLDDMPYQRYPCPLYPQYADTLNDVIRPSDQARDKFAPVYQMVYSHYKHYRNTELPYVKRILDNHFPEGPGDHNSNFSSALWWNIDVSSYASERDTQSAKVNVPTLGEVENRVVLVNVGSSKENKLVTDARGGVFVSDERDVRGGHMKTARGKTIVTGAKTQALYDTYRESDPWLGFEYDFPYVTKGTYRLKLHFVEREKEAQKQRLFNVYTQGNHKKATTIDIYKQTGKDQLYIYETNVTVEDEGLTIGLHPLKGTVVLHAIEVTKQ